MTDFKFLRPLFPGYMQYDITDEHDTIELTNVPDCYFRTAQRFGKIDVHYDIKQIDLYFRDGIGGGLTCKSYRVFKRDREVIVDPSGSVMLTVKMCQVMPENKTISNDILFCTWLYRQVFEGDCV